MRKQSSGWRPVKGSPPFRRILHEPSGNYRYHKVSYTEIGKSLKHAYALDEPCSYRRGNQGPRAKTADRDARNQATPVWKPFHQHGNGNNVAEPKANPANDAIA